MQGRGGSYWRGIVSIQNTLEAWHMRGIAMDGIIFLKNAPLKDISISSFIFGVFFLNTTWFEINIKFVPKLLCKGVTMWQKTTFRTFRYQHQSKNQYTICIRRSHNSPLKVAKTCELVENIDMTCLGSPRTCLFSSNLGG